MDSNDSQAINALFSKLAQVEQQSPPRDGQAEAFIRDKTAAQPGAPYYMAQTIIVQEQALNAAQKRIEELEGQADRAPAGGGGLLGSLFGGGQGARGRGSVPRAGSQPRGYDEPGYGAPAASPWGRTGGALGGGAGGGGFLAGAAQTAMGVAGGVLLGNAIAGMFGADEANAAEAGTDASDATADEAGVDDASYDDAGGDFGADMGDMDV
jgi:uncharacterized protein